MPQSNGSPFTTGFRDNTTLGNTDFGTIFVEKQYLIDTYPSISPNIKQSTLLGWGRNFFFNLGTNDNVDRSSPVQTISGGTNWRQVSSGPNSAAAIKSDGTLWNWGNASFNGNLGDNSTINKSSPVQTVSTGTNWSVVSAGAAHTVAIKTDGTLWGWGYNNSALGRGSGLGANVSSPVQTVSTGTNWKQVSAGKHGTSAVKTDGTLWLWGFNNYGVLGNNQGSFSLYTSPVQTVATGTNWCTSSFGGSKLLGAIKTDGTLWIWGRNTYGGLGINNTIARSSPVQTISTGTNWKRVMTSHCETAIALKTDGTLWAWGYNRFGTLGDNNTVHKSSPVQTVATGTNWASIPQNSYSVMAGAIKTDGTMWVWGGHGQYGLGTTLGINFGSSPAQILTCGTNWKQIAVGSSTTFVLREDGDW